MTWPPNSTAAVHDATVSRRRGVKVNLLITSAAALQAGPWS